MQESNIVVIYAGRDGKLDWEMSEIISVSNRFKLFTQITLIPQVRAIVNLQNTVPYDC